MKVYAVIVTYNGAQWIDKCFNSLLKSSIPITCVVVDNASTDNTVSLIKSNYPDVQIIENNSNMGFGGANNIGIRTALENDCDYIFLLNQDAWIEVNTIKELVGYFHKVTNLGIISPLHLNGAGTALDRNFSKYIGPISNCMILSDCLIGKLKSFYQVEYINCAAWLISAKCIKKVGGFDPVFFHYGEDVNYCHRVLYHGFSIGVTPNTRIWHDREDRGGGIREEFKALNERRAELISFLNINSDSFKEEIGSRKAMCFKFFIKSLLKFNLKKAKFWIDSFMEYKKQEPILIKSRELNIKGGAYLS
ncbi:glycosyltransferase family 2 protein [Flavihumibacter sp.]|uniref:glycosyltransferase family 2 protein n=1 Tax=Flavihumibacter sp. TaxID=1913981 RepID=UPI002FC6C243